MDLDGRTITFRSFILSGPYMSWKGFANLLLQFSIAKPPAANSRIGRSFHLAFQSAPFPFKGGESLSTSSSSSVTAPSYSSGGARGNGGDGLKEALLDMAEAVALFIESSRSFSPVLILTKYAPVYAELAAHNKHREGDLDREGESDGKERDRERAVKDP